MISKVNNLIDTGTDPKEVAVVTFTRKAAGEIRSRLSRKEVTIGTIHHLAREVWRRSGRTPRPLSRMDNGPARVRQIGDWIGEACMDDPELTLELETRREVLRRSNAGSTAAIPVQTLGLARLAIAMKMIGLAVSVSDKGVQIWLPKQGNQDLKIINCESSGGDIRIPPATLVWWQKEGQTLARIAERTAQVVGLSTHELDELRMRPRAPHEARKGTKTEWLALVGEIKGWMDVLRTNPDAEDPAARNSLGPGALAQLGEGMLIRYQLELKKERATDHDGYVLAGTNVAKRPEFKSPWSWLLVDEYQDVNPAQETFVRTIANSPTRNGTVRVWCVGDDWQAIFGFQNASVQLMQSFGEKYPGAEICRLEQTYRFGQALADAAGSIIAGSSAGIPKKIRGHPELNEHDIAIRIVSTDLKMAGMDRYGPEQNATGAILAIIDQIGKYDSKSDLLVIARNNASVEDSMKSMRDRAERTVRRWTKDPHTAPDGMFDRNEQEMFEKACEIAMMQVTGLDHARIHAKARENAVQVRLDVLTVHGAKGLEAEDVIVVDPGTSETPQDRAVRVREATLDLFRAYPHEMEREEARIWYVALTRAKSRAWIVVRGGGWPAARQVRMLVENARTQDLQVEENGLPDVCGGYLDPTICPSCGKGYLVLTPGGMQTWARCSRTRKCRYKEPACEICGQGILHKENGINVCSTAICREREQGGT